MIDKLKGFLTGGFGYVLALIMGLIAYIYSLRNKNGQLVDSLATEKSKEELGKVLNEKAIASEQANSAESDYQRARDEYLRSNMPGSDKGSGPSLKEEG